MAYPVARKLTRMSGTYGARKPIRLSDGTFTPNWHGGVDFTPLERGARIPAYAVGKGVVTIADRNTSSYDFSGLDVGIRLDGDGSIWWYGHLSRVDVRVGQRVTDGQQIGLIGATGRVTGVHLHLERHYPGLNQETDPWPHIKDEPDINGHTSSWQTGNPPVAVGDPGTTPPAKTPEQIEEEELMGAKEDIIARIEVLESRLKREARPEPIFVQHGADGREYDFNSSPYAALNHPASGFVFPLDPAPRAGQLKSQKDNYRLIAEDANPVGLSEHAFFGGIADSLIGAGRLSHDLSDDEKHAAARALFTD